MKVLITGATGFIGHHLCRQLVQAGYEVTAFHRPSSDKSLIADLPLHQVVGDITDAGAVARAVAGQDAVIHGAAHGAYWRQYKDVLWRVNVGGTRNVIAACRRQDNIRLLHVSSMVAIGVPAMSDQVADESFSFNLPASRLHYPASKHQAEQEVLAAGRSGLDVVIVNPTSVMGPHGAGFRGGEMIAKVVNRRIAGYFTGGRNVVHVEDVTKGIRSALERGDRGERYILGGENLSYKQIAQVVASQSSLDRLLIPVPPVVTWLLATLLEPAGKIIGKRPWITYDVHYFSRKHLYYDSGKAMAELDYAPRTFAAIAAEYLESQLDRTMTQAPA